MQEEIEETRSEEQSLKEIKENQETWPNKKERNRSFGETQTTRLQASATCRNEKTGGAE